MIMLKRYTEISIISLFSILPFALPLMLASLFTYNIQRIPKYAIAGIIFYVILWFIEPSLNLFILISIVAILPVYLSTVKKKDILRGLFIGLIILDTFLLFDLISHFYLHNEIKRISGLQHNAFIASQTLVYLSIILHYNRYLKHVSGFVLTLTLTKSGIILLPFIYRKKYFIATSLLALLLIATIDHTVLVDRVLPNQITSRLNLAQEHNYTTYKGFDSIYEESTTNQNPHNIFLNLTAQFGIIVGLIIAAILYFIYYQYGRLYGYWKLIPVIFYDQIDGSLLNNYTTLSLTIIYLYLMVKPYGRKYK